MICVALFVDIYVSQSFPHLANSLPQVQLQFLSLPVLTEGTHYFTRGRGTVVYQSAKDRGWWRLVDYFTAESQPGNPVTMLSDHLEALLY